MSEYIGIDIVREELDDALASYAFTHLGVNDAGMLILKRWLPLNTGMRIEVSYTVIECNGSITLQKRELVEGSFRWMTVAHLVRDRHAASFPSDGGILNMAREATEFDHSRM